MTPKLLVVEGASIAPELKSSSVHVSGESGSSVYVSSEDKQTGSSAKHEDSLSNSVRSTADNTDGNVRTDDVSAKSLGN